MSDLKEYVVTLYRYEDLENFYNDMESEGADLFIPNRQVECSNLRPVSRNTHYYLTDEEAEQLRNDTRVLAVERLPDDMGIFPSPSFTQITTSWDKSDINNVNAHRNWGLYRCTLNQQISNWGSNGTPSQAGAINITSSGKNVDVIIVDGHMNPTHPEYAINTDGTGGSRVNQFNWFSFNAIVNPSSNSTTYVYPPYVDPNYVDRYGDISPDRTDDNDHGAHVVGTACGNVMGWARDANIYNISPYSTNPSAISGTGISVFDYVKIFHRNKSVNAETGRKNPTIATNSWGYSVTKPLSLVQSILYRGTIVTGPFTVTRARSYGIYSYTLNGTDYFVSPYYYAALDADITDCISEGVILVGAAGNEFTRVVNSTSDSDYGNYIFGPTLGTIYYNRGSSPGASTNMICVGAVGPNYQEWKATFSNCGPRVDIYAPGSYIISSVNSSRGTYDSRNDTYFIDKFSGSSMATPQVTGVLACALELYPNMKQSDALNYLRDYAKYNQMTDGGGGTSTNSPAGGDATSLQGSTNRYLHYNQERPIDGAVYPKINTHKRPSSGQTYPRPRIYSYGRQTPV